MGTKKKVLFYLFFNIFGGVIVSFIGGPSLVPTNTYIK